MERTLGKSSENRFLGSRGENAVANVLSPTNSTSNTLSQHDLCCTYLSGDLTNMYCSEFTNTLGKVAYHDKVSENISHNSDICYECCVFLRLKARNLILWERRLKNYCCC